MCDSDDIAHFLFLKNNIKCQQYSFILLEWTIPNSKSIDYLHSVLARLAAQVTILETWVHTSNVEHQEFILIVWYELQY